MSDEIAVLFADLCDSTTLYETMGDRDAQRAIGAALLQMAAIVEANAGKPLKFLGDGLMASFDRPETACEAACQMQEQLGTYFRAGEMRTGLRVGINCDRVVRTGDDIYGDAVNVAARIVARANVNQILVTRATADLLSPLWQARVRPVDRLYVKGKRLRVEVCEVIWKQEGVTVAKFELPHSTQILPMLEVKLGDRQEWVSRDRPVLKIGREPENDLRVQEDLVSRYHARIEFRPRQFWLVDRSTNGTYVHFDRRSSEKGSAGGEDSPSEPKFVRWAEVPLDGRGWLGLGESVAADAADAIWFGVGGLPSTGDE